MSVSERIGIKLKARASGSSLRSRLNKRVLAAFTLKALKHPFNSLLFRGFLIVAGFASIYIFVLARQDHANGDKAKTPPPQSGPDLRKPIAAEVSPVAQQVAREQHAPQRGALRMNGRGLAGDRR